MTAILISPISGLSFSTGLSLGAGLQITNQFAGYGIIFQGGGGVSAKISDQGLEAFVTFSGTGSLQPTISLALKASLTLAGAGGAAS